MYHVSLCTFFTWIYLFFFIYNVTFFYKPALQSRLYEEGHFSPRRLGFGARHKGPTSLWVKRYVMFGHILHVYSHKLKFASIPLCSFGHAECFHAKNTTLSCLITQHWEWDLYLDHYVLWTFMSVAGIFTLFCPWNKSSTGKRYLHYS